MKPSTYASTTPYLAWIVLGAALVVSSREGTVRAESPAGCEASWWKEIDVRSRLEGMPSEPLIFLPATWYWHGQAEPVVEGLGLEVRDAAGRLFAGQVGSGLPNRPGIYWWRPSAPLPPAEYTLRVDVPSGPDAWNCAFPPFQRSVSFEVTGAPLVVPDAEAHITLEKRAAYELSHSDKCGYLDDETLCANVPTACCRYADMGTYVLRAGGTHGALPEGQGAYFDLIVEVDAIDYPHTVTMHFNDRSPPYDFEQTSPWLYVPRGELCATTHVIGLLTDTVVDSAQRCVATTDVLPSEPPPPPPSACDPAMCLALAYPGPAPEADPSPEVDATPDADGPRADDEAHTRSGDGGCGVSGATAVWGVLVLYGLALGRRRG